MPSTTSSQISMPEGHAAQRADVAYQAYQILHVAFVLASLIAGFDKFLHMLTNWDGYLAPMILNALSNIGVTGHDFMLGVGVIEIIAGLLVAFKPKIGAYVIAAWLLGIIANFLLLGGYYDVALRDFGLFLGAVALGRLSQKYGH
jgi:hypothetical protein